MSLVIVDVGKLKLLGDTIASTLSGAKAFLYTNNKAPAHGDTFSSYVEPTWSGYARQGLSAWSSPALSADFHAQTTASPVTFTNAGPSPANVYGWGILHADGATLLGAEQFSGAPLTVGAGQSLVVTPTYTRTSEF
jgi:hypothetical protein